MYQSVSAFELGYWWFGGFESFKDEIICIFDLRRSASHYPRTEPPYPISSDTEFPSFTY